MTNPRRKREFLRKNGVEIELYIDGEGPAFVILPSYGHGISADFDAITARVVEAGWTVLRPQPRGIAGSKGPMTNLTMHDLANDVAFSIRSVSDGPAVLLGHAFGNMLARMVTTDHPDLVTAVVQCVFFGIAAPNRGCSDQPPHRINLVLRAEHAFCIREGRSKHQQRCAHFLLAFRVPVGHFEAAGTLLADLDRILQVVILPYVVRICRIDQYADYQQDVARADLLPGKGVAACVIGDHRRIHVLIDHL